MLSRDDARQKCWEWMGSIRSTVGIFFLIPESLQVGVSLLAAELDFEVMACRGFAVNDKVATVVGLVEVMGGSCWGMWLVVENDEDV